MKVADLHSFNEYLLNSYLCLKHARHIMNNIVYAFMKLTFKLSFPSFLTNNSRPTDVTSVAGEYINLNSDYPQRAMKHLTYKEAYTS